MDDLIMKWDNLEKVLGEYAVELRNAYQDRLINSDRIATGELLNSVECFVEKDNVVISVVLELADYWKYVEYDTKPHWPPKDAISEWIKFKPILPDNRFGYLPTPEQLNFLIRRKISEKGTKGTNDLHNTVEEINEKYIDLIEQAITEDIEQTSTAILTQFFKD